jgi:transposase-like protein
MSKETGKRLEDLRGSRPWSEAEARQVLDALARSGESVASFSRGAGLVPQRVSWWRKRLGSGDARAAAATSTGFVPVVVRAAAEEAHRQEAAAVVAFGGVRMEVRDLDLTSATWVAQVLRAVAEVPS